MLPAGTGGQGLPSGQIWALYFEPPWTALAANETLVVDAKKTNIVLKTNVRVALFRPVNINSPRLVITIALNHPTQYQSLDQHQCSVKPKIECSSSYQLTKKYFNFPTHFYFQQINPQNELTKRPNRPNITCPISL
jgi:hypothetical protein